MRQQEGQVCIASRFRTRTYSPGSDPLRPIVDGRVDSGGTDPGEYVAVNMSLRVKSWCDILRAE